MAEDMDRRELFRVIAAGTAAATVAAAQSSAPAAATPRFFTPAEYAMVDELAEIIIPADDHSPGARAARCAAYIDYRLSEELDPVPRQGWRDGLKLVDALSQKLNGAPFMAAAPEQRVAVVAAMAHNEEEPVSGEEKFFKDLKHRTVNAYYTSSIGIHQDMEYKGNVYLQEFVGWDANDGQWHMQTKKP